jgi:D-alanyl-lipoteichoic acid acyltransferase DltB (MBOAT superfamily)
MLFPTFVFGLFFLTLYALVWAMGRRNEWRKLILLVGSWIFYGAWDWRFVLLLMASAWLNFAAAALIDRLTPAGGGPAPAARRWVLIAGIALNLGILVTFKYYGFFAGETVRWLARLKVAIDPPLLQVILPVGVSFFTFQGMSYLIDVHRGRCVRASLLDVTLLMSFFAHLVAGPIVRGADLIPQFAATPRPDRDMATRGLLLIVWGLFKKTVIASQLATHLVDPVFFDPSAHGRIDLAAATYGYAVQIYCDFSAYSDMAIGLAALLGYRFPRNFDQPYRAVSLQDFWRRWHISLSGWLRDYLYVPLGGGRGGLWRVCRNLMITMLLGGLWHGASWTFVIWGALHGLVLCIERVWREVRPRGWPAAPRLLGLAVTFHVVCLGWIFFRASSFAGAMDFIGGFGRAGGPPLLVSPLDVALILAGLATQGLSPTLVEDWAERLRRWPAPALGAGVAAAVLVADALRPAGIAPFIYFQF